MQSLIEVASLSDGRAQLKPQRSDRQTAHHLLHLPLESDFIYNGCRIAALIYCKATAERALPTKVCMLKEPNHLWANMWRVKLSWWKQIPGIFLFIIASGLSATELTLHGKFTKAMFKKATSFIGLDYFDFVDAALMGFVKLQWLGTEGSEVQ
jgi:hypothetical protein